jgi:hypothetical protein
MLLAQLKISELKSAMHKVEAGLADPYDQMYDLNIQRIQNHRERALSILARLVVTKRALSIRELQESLVRMMSRKLRILMSLTSFPPRTFSTYASA